MTQPALRLIQLSDIHLLANKQGELLGVPTYASFMQVVAALQAEATPADLLLLSGDLSQDGSAEAYGHLAHLLKGYKKPIYFLPGNHDNFANVAPLLQHPEISAERHIVHDTWQIILLNSQIPGQVPGLLAPSELDFMQQCLTQYPKHPTVVAFHHHPVAVGSAWLDPLGLQNAATFWQKIVAFPQVKVVLFGHVHQELAGFYQHIPYYSAPATSIQFKKDSANFALDPLPPGYRWIELYANGELKTGVTRLAKYVGKFEAKAQGY